MTKQLSTDKLPKYLYKYRNWSDINHLRLITHQEIYFTRPSSFNDPFDGNIPVRWDLLTYEDCLQKNLELTKMFHKDKSLETQKQIAKKVTNSKKLWHPNNIKKETAIDIEKWDKIIGLVSLSEIKNDILMWSHYSDFHRGFVVGFHTNSLMSDYDFDYLNKVEYKEKYPLISGHDDTTERFRMKFFTKSNAWKYEQEWRISKNHIENRIVQLKKESLAEIIIGCQMADKEKKKIIKEVYRIFGDSVELYQAFKAEENFKLEIRRI